ncbi:MAG: replicative helicase, partial [Verrucomicrobiota bacterium]
WGESPPTDDITSALPHAVGPEKSVLSSMLQDPHEFIPLAIEEGLTAEHFYLPSHATLFALLLTLADANETIELVSLIQRLLDRGLLDRVGGPSAVTDIYGYSINSAHFRQHLAELRNKFAGRELIRISNATIASVYDSPDEIPETLERTEREVMGIRDMDAGEKPQTVRQAASVVMAKFEAELLHDPTAKGTPSGFEDLDRAIGGLKPGEMFVIGARPSVGKTALMMNVVEHVCLGSEVPTLVFSVEMSTEAITKRLIFSRAKFALSQLARGYTPTKGDLQRIQRVTLEVAGAKLFIDDKSGPTISYIRAKARRMKREHGIGLICIDYLGLIKSLSKQSQYSREREISEISAGVKGMAKDLGIPVILLAQLNRDVEKRSGKNEVSKPRMSDLKDSGSIEADADIIGLLSRDAYQGAEDSGRACLDLAKNRNGATGPIPLTFIAELMRFETGAPAQESEAAASQAPKSRHDY